MGNPTSKLPITGAANIVRLRDRLAAASKNWCDAKDDTERRKALQQTIKAFLDWSYAEALPPEHLLPLVELVSYLQDLNEGRRPRFFQPAERPDRGNPGRNTDNTAAFAVACAAVDALAEHPHGSVNQIEKHVLDDEVERLIKEKVDRRIAASAAKRAAQPGRRPELLRDYWITHQVEWHRVQGKKKRKTVFAAVGKPRDLSEHTIRKIYKKHKLPTKRREPNPLEKLMGITPMTDRELRELYRRDPTALLRQMEMQLTSLQEKARQQAEDLRRQEEELRHRDN
jgi:hypothetical protein